MIKYMNEEDLDFYDYGNLKELGFVLNKDAELIKYQQ